MGSPDGEESEIADRLPEWVKILKEYQRKISAKERSKEFTDKITEI